MMRTWANINGKLEFIGFCSARGEEWVDGGDGYMYSGNDVAELSCMSYHELRSIAEAEEVDLFPDDSLYGLAVRIVEQRAAKYGHQFFKQEKRSAV